MPLIFLSYRRRDSQTITRKIHQHLAETYGKDTVFLDEKSIPKGTDIRDYIRDTLSQCAVVLPVIAAEWLSTITAFGSSTSSWEKPSDWVRIELEEALACDSVKVVPLLIDGVDMPRADVLPEGLQKLSYRNGICISSKAFHEDRQRLVRELDRLIDGTVLDLPRTLSGPSDDEVMRQSQYRHEVRYCLESNNGRLDSVSQIYLDALRQHLQLTREVTKRIQEAAQQPYHRYTSAVRQLVAHQTDQAAQRDRSTRGNAPLVFTLDRRATNHLRRLHHNLNLPQWKALKIEQEIIQEWEEKHAQSGGQSRAS